jgi:hypothetical protein
MGLATLLNPFGYPLEPKLSLHPHLLTSDCIGEIGVVLVHLLLEWSVTSSVTLSMWTHGE